MPSQNNFHVPHLCGGILFNLLLETRKTHRPRFYFIATVSIVEIVAFLLCKNVAKRIHSDNIFLLCVLTR